MSRSLLRSLVSLLSLAAVPAWAGVNVWTPIGPDGGNVFALTAAAQQAGVLYAGTSGGVFKSADGGASWSWSSRGLPGGVVSLAVAPSNNMVLYAGTFNDLFLSRDGGATWSTPPHRLQRPVLALAVDPRDARRVWAGTGSGVWWSRDAGAHWSLTTTDLIARVTEIALDPVHPDTVYAAVEALEDFGATGIVKSTDAGATWTLRNDGLEAALPFSEDSARLAVDPTAPNIVYAAFFSTFQGAPPGGATFRSTDGGATWQATPGGYPLAVDRNGAVYAGAFRSTDHGATWQQAATPPDAAQRYAAGTAGDGTLWAGTSRLGVFRSRDAAAAWESASRGLHATTITSIAIDPEQPRILYAGASETGIRKTLSTGASWRPADSGLVTGFLAYQLLAIAPHQPQTVYLAASSQGTDGRDFARSDDGGQSWTVLWEPAADVSFAPTEVVADPEDPDVVYLTGDNVGTDAAWCDLARSDDRGVTRHCLPPFNGVGGVPRLVLDPGSPSTLWALDQRGLWKTTDRGDHWTMLHSRGLEHAGQPRSLLIDPVHAGRLFLGTRNSASDDRPERIWRSDDNGLSWRPSSGGRLPASADVTDLLIDAQQPSILYAAVEHFPAALGAEDLSGVYWSTNGGKTFYPLVSGLPGHVVRLTQSPKNPRQLYAATPDDGIYAFTRN